MDTDKATGTEVAATPSQSNDGDSQEFYDCDRTKLWQIPEVIHLAATVQFLFNHYVAGTSKSTFMIDSKTGKSSDVSDDVLSAVRNLGFVANYAMLVSADKKKARNDGILVQLPCPSEQGEQYMNRKLLEIDENTALQAKNEEANKMSWQEHLQFVAKRQGEEEAKKEVKAKAKAKKPKA